MTMPTFLVLGAARAATTSLHYYLEQHPGISMSSIKEPNFFAFDQAASPPMPLFESSSPMVAKSVRDRAAYEALFAHARPGDAVGEASPLYLYVRETPEQIARVLHRPRFIVILRNPIDRAYSHWLHINRPSADDAVAGFRAACERELAVGRAYTPYASGTHVLRMGLYDDQLDRYAGLFGAESLLALDYHLVATLPQLALNQVCDHLGVARHSFATTTQYNRSGVTRRQAGARAMGLVRAVQPRIKGALPAAAARRLGRLRASLDRPEGPPPCPADLRGQLAAWFRPSVDRLVEVGYLERGAWSDFT